MSLRLRTPVTVDIEIKGKPVMFITTASGTPSNEMLRRFPFLELDETTDQTNAIKQAQAKAAAEGKTLHYDPLITSALSKLKRVKVKIPFAQDLVKHFPSEHLIMRTHFGRLLDLIKASAALYQYQRKTDQDGFTLAEPQDYDNAIIPLRATTSNPMMIPLSKKQKMLLEECRKLSAKKNAGTIDGSGGFSVKEIEPHIPFLVQSKVYDALAKLQDLGFLESYIEKQEGVAKPIRFYKPVDFKLEDIPTWQDIVNCRKKGITGNGGNKGNTGNRGISDSNGRETSKKHKKTMTNNSKSNSPNSPNSPPKSTNDKKNFFENDGKKAEYLAKIVAIMSRKPKHDWSINDICSNLNLAGIAAADAITDLLSITTANPKNPTRIRRADENGLFWRLAEAEP